MATFSQTELDGLISCPKEITEPPKRDRKLDGAQFRNDAKLVASNETKGEFAMFIRQNEDFPENFSIGLTYSPHDGRDRITLLRCNGKQGTLMRVSIQGTRTRTSTFITQAKAQWKLAMRPRNLQLRQQNMPQLKRRFNIS